MEVEMGYKKIIDVSQYNGNINWNKVDCDGVIIRIAYRGYTVGTIKQDSKFITNMKGVTAVGIPVGIYFMSQAINVKEAEEEAKYTVDQIKNYKVSLPIFYDSELSGEKNNNGRADKLSKSQRTSICKAFCNKIIELGYMTGVYASTSWFKTNLNVSDLLDYYIWVAQYASKNTADHRNDMWQYTSKGSMSGISGHVDISHCYVEFDNQEDIEVIEVINKIDSKLNNAGLSETAVEANIKLVQKWTNQEYEERLKMCKLTDYKLLVVDGINGNKSRAAITIGLQVYLNTLGTKLKVDGDYGTKTNAAVKKYIAVKEGTKGVTAKLVQGILFLYGYNPQAFREEFTANSALTLGQCQRDNKLKEDKIAGVDFFTTFLKQK